MCHLCAILSLLWNREPLRALPPDPAEVVLLAPDEWEGPEVFDKLCRDITELAGPSEPENMITTLPDKDSAPSACRRTSRKAG